MAPSSTGVASGKKPSSTKMKPKASLSKKASATELKKGSRAWKTAGKKTQSMELVESLHDKMPELEPVASHPVLNTKPVSMKVTPLKKASAPPSKTSTPKSRVSLTRSSTWIKKELESHKEPKEEQEPKTATEEHATEDGGEADDKSPRASSSLESHVKETTVEPMEGEEEGEQPRKGLSEILAMVPPFGADLDAWRANGGVSEFWIELIKFLLRHSRKKYWVAMPSTAASFMGPAFQMQWHTKMGNQLTVKLLACRGPVYSPFEEWVEGDRKAVMGRDNKPPFDTWALRHQTEHEATLAGNKEPDENLKAAIKAKEKVWNALSTAKQAQHLLAMQTYCQAGLEGNKETAGKGLKAAGSKHKAMVNITSDNSKRPNKRAKSSTMKTEGKLLFTIPDVVMSTEMAWRDADFPTFLKHSGTFLQCLHHLICDSECLHLVHSESLRILHSDLRKSGEIDDDNFSVMVSPQNAHGAANAIYHIQRGKLIPVVNKELEKAQVAYHHCHDNSSEKGESSCWADKGKQQAKCEYLRFVSSVA
ncbi:hypothetical protein DACRYDRAFT_110414 [Dacryopinax primogenitus]|uniref:Uncharacterized protein n=1 Tax=Dacryopinax primogenitus (strain DJM 731) TaxID=1858805 RepID=M5FZW0_DACPD|nr:uncharacterized protein DACRYDRAFT_110414 [Dacryopinax primogenitus]EJT99096.1 hypothetical protein DACRYDRAFT_110414 [Dacryopinax primogenitus]